MGVSYPFRLALLISLLNVARLSSAKGRDCTHRLVLLSGDKSSLSLPDPPDDSWRPVLHGGVSHSSSLLSAGLPPASLQAYPSLWGKAGPFLLCVELPEAGSEGDVREAVEAVAGSRTPAVLLLSTFNSSLAVAARDVLDERPVTDAEIRILGSDGMDEEKEVFVAKQSPRWRTMRVNRVFILPPFGFEVPGLGIIGADVDVTHLIAGDLGVSLKFDLCKTFEELSVKLLGGASDLSVTQPAQVVQQLRLGLEVSTYISRPELGFRYLLPGRVDRYLTLVAPFTRAVWVCLALSILSVAAFLSLAGFFGHTTSTFYKLAIAGVSLINESMPELYLSVRHAHKAVYIALFAWIILSSLLSKAYNSTLLASLVAVGYEEPVDTWQEILDKGILLPMAKGTTISDSLQFSDNPALRRVYRELVVDYETSATPEFLLELQEKGEAISLTTDYLMVGFRHKMLMGVDRIPFGYSGFLMSLKYPHKERIDSLISTFHELGIYQHLRSKYEWMMALPERTHERANSDVPKSAEGLSVSSDVSFSPLAPQHLLPAILLAAGVGAVAAAAFFAEVASERARRLAAAAVDGWWTSSTEMATRQTGWI